MPRTYYWPACTVSGCRHRLHHGTEAALGAVIREHRGEWVNTAGQAVCACHDEATAQTRRVDVRFPCNGDYLGRFA